MTKGKRPIRIEGNLAYVPLTRGYEAVIDAEDVHLVEGWNWTALVCVGHVYAFRIISHDNKTKAVLMHRVIMGEPEGLLVDHKDGNGLNNQKRGDAWNLRVATRSQNAQNQGVRKNNTSRLKGVSWHKASGKWVARIMLEGKETWLGSFKCRTAAAVAYMKASRKHHGDFGRTAHGQRQQATGGPGSLQDSVSGSPIQPA